MQLSQVGLKGVGGSTAPAAIELDRALARVPVDEATAGAFAPALLALFYPAQADRADLLRLSGGSMDTAWRVVVDTGARAVRVSRRAGEQSVVVEVSGAQPGTWDRVAWGTTEASERLASLLNLPPRALFKSVVLGTNGLRRVAEEGGDADPEDESRVTLVTSEDLLGEMAAGVEAGDVELSVAERHELGRRFLRARTRENVEDYVRGIEERQTSLTGEMSRLVNDSGEMAQVHRAISELPPTRALTPEERNALQDPSGREADLRRRLEEAEAELSRLRSGRSAGVRVAMIVVALGSALGLALSLYSVFGPPGSHRFAVGNLVAFGAALFGGLRWIGDEERRERGGRRLEAVERRREQLETDLALHVDLLRELRRELDVATMEDYEQRAGARKRYEAQLAELKRKYAAQADSPRYRELEKESETLGLQTRQCRSVLSELGEDEGFSSLMETRLRAGGWLPGLVLWSPLDDRAAVRAELADLVAALRSVGHWEADGLPATVREGWRKIAGRVVGAPVEGLDLLPSGMLTIDGIHDALENLGVERCWVFLETLRLALITSLSRSEAWSWPMFIVRTCPLRLSELELAMGLERVYESLARKLQVVVVDVA